MRRPFLRRPVDLAFAEDLSRRRIEDHEFPGLVANHYAVAHAVENRLQNAGLLPQHGFAAGQFVGPSNDAVFQQGVRRAQFLGHAIEGGRQHADFIGRGDVDARGQGPQGNGFGRAGQLDDGPGEATRQQVTRHQSQGQCSALQQPQHTAQPRDGSIDFGRIDAGHESPVFIARPGDTPPARERRCGRAFPRSLRDLALRRPKRGQAGRPTRACQA